MIETAPLPDMTGTVEAPFWAALAQGQLVVQHCAPCGEWMFPTRVRCAGCGGVPEWKPVSGRGRIWSFTWVHPPVLPVFAPYAPYPVVVIELAEQPGLRMVGNLVAEATSPINAVQRQDVVIGAPVELVVRDLGGAPWPGWRISG